MPQTTKRTSGRQSAEQAGAQGNQSVETGVHAPEREGSPQQPQQGGQRQDGGARQDGRRGQGLNITELKDMSIQRLTQVAKDLNVAGATGMRKQELIFQILKAQTEQ